MIEALDAANVALGSGIFGAAAVVLTALIKARSGDRETIISSQQNHMTRLGTERNEAIKDRDVAYDEADKWRERYEGEVRQRIEAQATAQTALLTVEALRQQVSELVTQVHELQAEVSRLKVVVER